MLGRMRRQASSRILIWKLGKDFLSREGKDWRKSFDAAAQRISPQ
jgi:hypothetical protein